MRRAAGVFVAALLVALAVGPAVIPHGYAEQDREAILRAPEAAHWLGTDALGRDNLARFLHGGRLSLAMGAAAALGCCVLSAMAGTAAALGGRVTRAAGGAALDAMLSIPWYLLVFLVRAAMPLEAPPVAMAGVTFGILAFGGWAQTARTVRDAVTGMQASGWMRLARASGYGGWRLWRAHIVPNLVGLLRTQFLLLLPALLLGESTLGMLGLGVPEPLPSWGGMLVDLLQPGAVGERPWTLAPAVLLALTSISLRTLGAPAGRGAGRSRVWRQKEALCG
jgi:ABC-type dipeptide/oligopeptide/nickel transport system permease subunit